MANGKLHGKRRTGVRITNPLPLPASVKIKSPTGALHTGDGKETWRTVRPGETLYIPTKGRAELEIDVSILRYDPAGNSTKIGDGSWEHVATKSTPKGKAVLGTVGKPIQMVNTGDVDPDGDWHVITAWTLPGNALGNLQRVSFDIQPMEPGANGQVRLEVGDLRNTRVRNLGGKDFYRKTALDFKKVTLIQPDEIVRIVAKAKGGIVRVTGAISGLETPYHEVSTDSKPPKMPRPLRKVKPKEPEEPPLRSLGDMIEDMRRKEEAVKV